jgi:hypothetical protein
MDYSRVFTTCSAILKILQHFMESEGYYLWVLHPVAYLSNWFLVIPSIATKFQYVTPPFLLSFSLTTCFGPYGPSTGEVYN